MSSASIDFSKITGRIKPLHGVNNAPEPDCEAGYRDVLAKAGIPFVRLHDMGGHYAAARYVDIANVFPDFDKDPADPASYDFAFTDWLIADIYRQGSEVVYRLGASIECEHFIKPRNIFRLRITTNGRASVRALSATTTKGGLTVITLAFAIGRFGTSRIIRRKLQITPCGREHQSSITHCMRSHRVT
jgi:hypothetical protein